MLGRVTGVGEGQSDGQADEVDVGDVSVELGAVEGEFAEIPDGVVVGVTGVADGWFDEAGA